MNEEKKEEEKEKGKINSWHNPYAVGCLVIFVLFIIIVGVAYKHDQKKKEAEAQLAREAAAAKEEVRKAEEARKVAAVQRGSFTDARDKKAYKTVKIGDQIWMAENLNYNASGSKCYDNKPDNCVKYGRLYNWNTAIKACPKGWHLPSAEEWQILVNFVGETAGKKLKATSGYNADEGKSGNGTDNYGFSALPGGQSGSDGKFLGVGRMGTWWTASECGNDWGTEKAVCNRGMGYRTDDVQLYLGGSKRLLFSVRCLQD